MNQLNSYISKSNNYPGFIEIKDDNTVVSKEFRTTIYKQFNSEVEAINYFNSLEKKIVKEGFKKEKINETKVLNTYESYEQLLKCFKEIIQNESIFNVIDFLKLIDKKDKTEFKKELKRLKKYYDEYIEFKPGHWSSRGTQMKTIILSLVALGLMNKTEVKSWSEVFELLKDFEFSYVNDVIEFAKPNWISDFIKDNSLKNEWNNFDYEKLLKLESLKMLEYSEELFVNSLSRLNFWDVKEVEDHDFLFSNKTVFTRDIPLLLEFPTNISNYTFNTYGIEKKQKPWLTIFLKLIEENKLNRNLVIEKCLDNQLKNWNANQIRFFKDLFDVLQVTKEESLNFQNKLFLLLPISNKTINAFGVKEIKKIAFEKQFNKKDFLEWTSTVLNNFEAKTSIKTLLIIFEKHAKTSKDFQQEILVKTADVFLINDYELQRRAANLILKFGNNKQEDLVEKLQNYQSQMLGKISQDFEVLFKNFTIENEELLAETIIDNEEISHLKIEQFDSWENIFYAIGNTINSETPLDFEIVINSFLTQKHLFPDDYVEKLKIYYKPTKENYKGSASFFDLSLLLNFITNNKSAKLTLATNYKTNKIIEIKKELDIYAFNLNKLNANLPLLSFPTHYPSHIEIGVLMDRIITYHQKNIDISPYDLMIAINRILPVNFHNEYNQIINLPENFQTLFQMILEPNDEIALQNANLFLNSNTKSSKESLFNKALNFLTQKNEKLEYWHKNILLDTQVLLDKSFFDCVIMATRIRFPDVKIDSLLETPYKTIPFAYEKFEPKFEYKTITYTSKSYSNETVTEVKDELYVDFTNNSFKNYLYFSNLKPLKVNFTTFWEQYENDNTFSTYDMRSMFSLMPQFPEPVYASLLNYGYRKSSYFSENSSRELLVYMMNDFFKMDYFSLWFLVCSQLADKREIRMLSTEVLLFLIEKNKIDNEEFSKKILFLHEIKYGSIQRFFDNLETLKDVSKNHNVFILHTIEKLIITFSKLEKKPINTKKILEILFDLKVKANDKLSDDLRISLEKWQKTASLKKIIDNLLKI